MVGIVWCYVVVCCVVWCCVLLCCVVLCFMVLYCMVPYSACFTVQYKLCSSVLLKCLGHRAHVVQTKTIAKVRFLIICTSQSSTNGNPFQMYVNKIIEYGAMHSIIVQYSTV